MTHGAIEEQRVGSFDADPRVFQSWVYRALNADLAGYAEADLVAHWILHGLAEGRRASLEYASGDYLARYADLAQAYGTDFAATTHHFVFHGLDEGRVGTVLTDPLVYDGRWYLANNVDLTPAQWDRWTLGVHWLLHGVAEGRQAQPSFLAAHYRARYADLTASYADGDWVGVTRHYVLIGHAQGRDGH